MVLRAQEPVEVWCQMTARWVGGFEVSGVQDDGSVRLRRGDAVELPAALSPDRVRVANDRPSPGAPTRR